MNTQLMRIFDEYLGSLNTTFMWDEQECTEYTLADAELTKFRDWLHRRATTEPKPRQPITLNMPIHGIQVTLIPAAHGMAGSITSNLGDDSGTLYSDDYYYDARADMVEAMILEHARAGVDILDHRYVQGVQDAVQAMR